MKVLVLYKKNSEHYPAIEDYVKDLRERLNNTNVRIEFLNADTREGSAMASIYDIFSFPAILVLQMNGSTQNSWEGEELPSIDEVLHYALA